MGGATRPHTQPSKLLLTGHQCDMLIALCVHLVQVDLQSRLLAAEASSGAAHERATHVAAKLAEAETQLAAAKAGLGEAQAEAQQLRDALQRVSGGRGGEGGEACARRRRRRSS